MNTHPLWSTYLQAFYALTSSRMALASSDADFTDDLKASLLAPGWECPAALEYVEFLDSESVLPLLDVIVTVALTVHGSTQRARRVIASLPRAEAISALDVREIHITASNDFEQWGCLMELWAQLERTDRAEALARRGLTSADDDVREISELFLSRS